VWIDQCCANASCYDTAHPNSEGQARVAQLATSHLLAAVRPLGSIDYSHVVESPWRTKPLLLTEDEAEYQISPEAVTLDFTQANVSSLFVGTQGWHYYEDVPGKAGWISVPEGNLPAEAHEQRKRATPPASDGEPHLLRLDFTSGPRGSLQVGYLQSYDRAMGTADLNVTCGGSVTQRAAAHAVVLDGQHNTPYSTPSYEKISGLPVRVPCRVLLGMISSMERPKFKVTLIKWW